MNTRYLLMTCLSLIVGSIFLAPETIRIGVSQPVASGLSQLLLLGGMITAAMTVHAEARDKRVQETQKDDR